MSAEAASSASQGATGNPSQGLKHPPPTPIYVLRGHASPIHALSFCRDNSRLVSGDADGWVIVWDMATKRPVAAWKAHSAAVLGAQGVCLMNSEGNAGENRIFTHGRDHTLRVWRLETKDEEYLDKTLPVDEQDSSQERNEPWLIHSLSVNTLNFCPFAHCFIPPEVPQETERSSSLQPSNGGSKGLLASQMFLAVPNALNTGGLDILHLPSERRLSVISPSPSINTGMVMALNVFFSSKGDLHVASGYEDGRVMVHVRHGPISVDDIANQARDQGDWDWQRVYMSKQHSQPVLSLDVCPVTGTYFLTSSADALIVKHPIPELSPKSSRPGSTSTSEQLPMKVVNTKHAGQQGLKIRSDGKIFVTAGWDSRNRVYSCKTMKELAVLKWHKEGCYATALADVKVNFDNNATANEPVDRPQSEQGPAKEQSGNGAFALTRQAHSLEAIKLQRSQKAQLTHWIAGGSKDGKISLWDLY